MAREIHVFSVTVPINTPIAAPQLTSLAMPPRIVTGVTIGVPPGPRGMVGFALAAAGVAIIPYEPGAWFVTDNEVIEYELEEQISSGGWQLLAYNLGAFPHTLEIRFRVDLPATAAAGGLIPAEQLAPSSTVSLAPADATLTPASLLPPPPLPSLS